MKRILLMSILTAVLLSACTVNIPYATEKQEPSYAGTLRVGVHSYFWSSEPYAPVMKSMNARSILQWKSQLFMRDYPDVQIEFIDVDYNRNTQAILDDPSLMPDIIELTVNEARLLFPDRIENLTGRIEQNRDSWEGDYMKVVDMAKIDDDAYLLPITSNPLLVFYDRGVFGSLGLPEPQEGWTWDEFAEIGERLKDNGYPLSHASYTLSEMEPVIRGLGGRYASPDLSEVRGYFDSEETALAFSAYADMLRRVRDESGTGMRMFGLLRASNIMIDMGRDLAGLPVSADGFNTNNALVTGLAIAKGSEQQELAWAYMKYLLGDSSEEAMEFVVSQTLGNDMNDSSLQHYDPAFDKVLREWMRREIPFAPPATLDLVWYDSNTIPRFDTQFVPHRTGEQLLAYTDPDSVRGDLEAWAKQIEAKIRSIDARR